MWTSVNGGRKRTEGEAPRQLLDRVRAGFLDFNMGSQKGRRDTKPPRAAVAAEGHKLRCEAKCFPGCLDRAQREARSWARVVRSAKWVGRRHEQIVLLLSLALSIRPHIL